MPGSPEHEITASIYNGSTRSLARSTLTPPSKPRQVTGLIGSRLAKGELTRVLEIGAGRGRIASAVADAIRGTERVSLLRYRAYNNPRFVSADEESSARSAIAKLVVAGATASYITDLADVRALPDEHADVVLLCNVLHEIPVTEWLALFKVIGDCSRPGATLMVVEDQQPRIGELPHPRGFLLLEENEWKALVGDVVSPVRQAHGGRDLTAFTTPVAALSRATRDPRASRSAQR